MSKRVFPVIKKFTCLENKQNFYYEIESFYQKNTYYTTNLLHFPIINLLNQFSEKKTLKLSFYTGKDYLWRNWVLKPIFKDKEECGFLPVKKLKNTTTC